jgi:hypothetical protein
MPELAAALVVLQSLPRFGRARQPGLTAKDSAPQLRRHGVMGNNDRERKGASGLVGAGGGLLPAVTWMRSSARSSRDATRSGELMTAAERRKRKGGD